MSNNLSLIEPILEYLNSYEGFSSVTVSIDREYVDTPQGLADLNPGLVLLIDLWNPPPTWKQDLSCIVFDLDEWQLEAIEVSSVRASCNEGYFIESMFLFSRCDKKITSDLFTSSLLNHKPLP